MLGFRAAPLGSGRTDCLEINVESSPARPREDLFPFLPLDLPTPPFSTTHPQGSQLPNRQNGPPSREMLPLLQEQGALRLRPGYWFCVCVFVREDGCLSCVGWRTRKDGWTRQPCRGRRRISRWIRISIQTREEKGITTRTNIAPSHTALP